MRNDGRMLLAALSFLLTTNLFDSIFGDDLGTLPTPRDPFLAQTPTRVVAVLGWTPTVAVQSFCLHVGYFGDSRLFASFCPMYAAFKGD
jgi:hypothetical protein